MVAVTREPSSPLWTNSPIISYFDCLPHFPELESNVLAIVGTTGEVKEAQGPAHLSIINADIIGTILCFHWDLLFVLLATHCELGDRRHPMGKRQRSRREGLPTGEW